ncbi:hypothetical protein HPB50_022689 [Hyalomma asiaticum]|uniref:Uncharacterized protein n=1 Tax=Hyalomma asiaticum TaxID=266040 RepID=A0ACB7T5X8_HYAAI|nr:hypothetical protein HPB50_022689 [Hyalomma asiaticum]
MSYAPRTQSHSLPVHRETGNSAVEEAQSSQISEHRSRVPSSDDLPCPGLGQQYSLIGPPPSRTFAAGVRWQRRHSAARNSVPPWRARETALSERAGLSRWRAHRRREGPRGPTCLSVARRGRDKRSWLRPPTSPTESAVLWRSNYGAPSLRSLHVSGRCARDAAAAAAREPLRRLRHAGGSSVCGPPSQPARATPPRDHRRQRDIDISIPAP